MCGFSTHSCSILQRSPGYLVCRCELSMPPCLRFSVSSMNWNAQNVIKKSANVSSEKTGWRGATPEWMGLEWLPCICSGQGQVTWSWKEFLWLFLVQRCITHPTLSASVTPAIDFFGRYNLEEHFVPLFMKDSADDSILPKEFCLYLQSQAEPSRCAAALPCVFCA